MPRDNYDWRAIGMGAAVETIVVPVLIVASGSIGLAIFLGPVVGGAVTGMKSGNFGDEYVDGGFAGVAGVVLSGLFLVVLLYVAGETLGSLFVVGLFLGIGIPVSLAVGAVTGYATARIRYRRAPATA